MSYRVRFFAKRTPCVPSDALTLDVGCLVPKCNLLILKYTKSGLQSVLFLVESHRWAIEESIAGLWDGVLLYVSPCFDIDRFLGKAGLTEGCHRSLHVVAQIADLPIDCWAIQRRCLDCFGGPEHCLPGPCFQG